MRTAVISDQGLRDLLGRMCATSRLMAPVRRGKVSFDFEWIDDPSQVVFDYVRTVMPPKKAIWPTRDTMLEFDLTRQQASPVLDEAPFVLFGIHACDLMAVNQLDWAMGQRHGVPDPHYLARRRAATIVGMECMPDEYCFCTSVGSCETRQGADVFLTPIGTPPPSPPSGRGGTHGERFVGYFVEVLSDKGEALAKQAPGVREATADDGAAAKAYLEKKKQSTTLKINAEMAELPDLLEPRYDTEVFASTALRCYSCGTCTNVCPTCFCFDVDDQVDLLLQGGTRGRSYDSCQFQDFAIVAGGHNFRGERTDRVRHRWFRKFVYLLREHGMPFCIGCGRCSSACTANISLVDVLNAVIAEARNPSVRAKEVAR
jgi:sulfhydrogenase subunit beta (sulfur reductase)